MASLYKIKDSWYLHWTENGNQKKLSLGRIPKAEARRIKNQREALLYDRKRVLFVSGGRFDRFAESYIAWYSKEFPASSEHVKMVINVYLSPYFGHDYLGTLTIQQAEEYKHWRLQTVSAGTVKRELQILQAILNKAVEWQEIRENPLKGLKPPKNLNSKPIRWYSKAELQLIYQTSSKMRRAVWILLSNTGLRRTEALNLKWSHVSDTEITISSEHGKRTKSGKYRVIPLSGQAKEALKTLETLLQSTVLPKVEPHSLTTAFKRDLVASGLDGNLHCLRHTFAAHLLMKGVPLYTVSQLLGHADISTTQIYAHLSDEHLANAVEGLDL